MSDEEFIGTVDASAQATTFLDPSTPAATTNDDSELVIADYVTPYRDADSGHDERGRQRKVTNAGNRLDQD